MQVIHRGEVDVEFVEGVGDISLTNVSGVKGLHFVLPFDKLI